MLEPDDDDEDMPDEEDALGSVWAAAGSGLGEGGGSETHMPDGARFRMVFPGE